MRIVAALGGNALLRREQKPDADVQAQNIARAVAALAPLAEDHELVVTHGNGPQVGVPALGSQPLGGLLVRAVTATGIERRP